MPGEKRVKLTIDLDEGLAARLSEAARELGAPPAALAADCVAQSLEVAVRHRAALQRVEQVDEALIALAGMLGEMRAAAEAMAAGPQMLCRYEPPVEEVEAP